LLLGIPRPEKPPDRCLFDQKFRVHPGRTRVTIFQGLILGPFIESGTMIEGKHSKSFMRGDSSLHSYRRWEYFLCPAKLLEGPYSLQKEKTLQGIMIVLLSLLQNANGDQGFADIFPLYIG
jgi:hypothetical protein